MYGVRILCSCGFLCAASNVQSTTLSTHQAKVLMAGRRREAGGGSRRGLRTHVSTDARVGFGGGLEL